MSAWDVAGAVGWGAFALSFAAAAFGGDRRPEDAFWTGLFGMIAIGFVFPTAFCIARLCGASA